MLAAQLLSQFRRTVDAAESLFDPGSGDAYCPRLLVGVEVVARQALRIAVKDQPDECTFAIDDRRTTVATDDVRGADKV